jgi:hypothetical protein
MKTKVRSHGEKMAQDALKALRRAAKKAIELARATRTHAWVLQDGRIVDIARRKPNPKIGKRKRTKKSAPIVKN